jgi:hypothetical protein
MTDPKEQGADATIDPREPDAMTEPSTELDRTELDRIVMRAVFIRGANRPFGELTLEDARTRADELRAVTGWGPTVRVAPVAQAWRELAMAMERTGSASVGELDPAVVVELAQRLWVVLPGGPMMS